MFDAPAWGVGKHGVGWLYFLLLLLSPVVSLVLLKIKNELGIDLSHKGYCLGPIMG